MITAKIGKKPTLEIPDEIYEALNLVEGQTVDIAIIATQTHKLTKDEILANLKRTRGIWADDRKIAEAFDYLEKKWKEWEPIKF